MKHPEILAGVPAELRLGQLRIVSFSSKTVLSNGSTLCSLKGTN
jgi:hypothetical protein